MTHTQVKYTAMLDFERCSRGELDAIAKALAEVFRRRGQHDDGIALFTGLAEDLGEEKTARVPGAAARLQKVR